MTRSWSFSRWLAVIAVLMLASACGDPDQSTATVAPTATASSSTPPATTAPISASSAPPSTSTEPQRPPQSSETVTDPTGDVVVSQRLGDLPDYEPRADLLSYTLSWDDVVRFSLTTAEIDPSQIENVWLAFDVDEKADGPPPSPQDKSPTFVVFSASGGDGLYELRDMYTFVCPVRRSIAAGSFVVEFDAECLGDTTSMRLRSPYPWSYFVGEPPISGSSFPTPPYASYTDEMSGSGPIVRSI